MNVSRTAYAKEIASEIAHFIKNNREWNNKAISAMNDYFDGYHQNISYFIHDAMKYALDDDIDSDFINRNYNIIYDFLYDELTYGVE